jgi:hypothetical protein
VSSQAQQGLGPRAGWCSVPVLEGTGTEKCWVMPLQCPERARSVIIRLDNSVTGTPWHLALCHVTATVGQGWRVLRMPAATRVMCVCGTRRSRPAPPGCFSPCLCLCGLGVIISCKFIVRLPATAHGVDSVLVFVDRRP